MIKSILLPIDGSAYTDAQVKHCIQLAKAFQAKVKVVSIVDIRIFEWAAAMGADGFVPVAQTTVYQQESRKILNAKAEAVLDKGATILAKAGIEFETEKIDGPPADIINEFSHLVDLLIMGTRGEFAKWKRHLVGSTLDAVIRQCNKPIFMTQQHYEKVSRIIFAYDGSSKSNKALQLTGEAAAKLAVPLVILSVHHNEQIRNKFLQEAQTYLEPYKIEVELLGVSGNPEKEIIGRSEENKCNLIIMGAFRHSRIREAILGSTTEHVIRKTNIPVLLAK